MDNSKVIYDELDKSLNDMASWLLWSALENLVDRTAWEDTPEIGEYDFDRIIEAAQKLLPPDITAVRYEAVLEYFAQRAEKAVT